MVDESREMLIIFILIFKCTYEKDSHLLHVKIIVVGKVAIVDQLLLRFSITSHEATRQLIELMNRSQVFLNFIIY